VKKVTKLYSFMCHQHTSYHEWISFNNKQLFCLLNFDTSLPFIKIFLSTRILCSMSSASVLIRTQRATHVGP